MHVVFCLRRDVSGSFDIFRSFQNVIVFNKNTEGFYCYTNVSEVLSRFHKGAFGFNFSC